MFKFNDTNLAHNLSEILYNEKYYTVAEAHADKLFVILFNGIAETLKDNKDKTIPTTFIIDELDGKFIAGCTLEYFDGNPGNWSLTWTFDENDVPANAKKVQLQNDLTHHYFRIVAIEKFGIKFLDRSAMTCLMTCCVEQLYKWLDENAKEGEEVGIELDSVFKAWVEVKDGKKIFAVEPAGEIKTLIKDDAAIEK